MTGGRAQVIMAEAGVSLGITNHVLVLWGS